MEFRESMQLAVFHGTRHAAEIMESGTFVPSTGGEFGPGIYFSPNPDTAKFYALHVARGVGAPTVLSAMLTLKNPYVVKKVDWIKKTEKRTPRTVQRALMKKGHDAIIGIAINDYERQIVVFDPSRVSNIQIAEVL